MKTILISAILLVSACGLLADVTNVNFKMGDTSFTIPVPVGYAPVTEKMSELKKMSENYVVPQNTLLASFIPEADVPAAERDEAAVMPRTMSIQTMKKLLTQDITWSDFTEFKKILREQQLESVKKVEEQLPGFLDKANQKMKQELNRDVVFRIGGVVPFPPHFENDRALSFSMLVNVSGKDAEGKSVTNRTCATSTFLYLRGKILFVYAYAREEDLEWTREISKSWTAAILAANPSDALTAARESAPSSRGAFNWAGVLLSALIGAGIGGLLGLGRFVTRKKKSA